MLYMLLTVGCAQHQATAGEPVAHNPAPPAPNVHEALIHEAREEAELLRAELAAVKIATAKQQAELRAARRQLESFKTREETLGADVEKNRESLLIVEGERDRLRREVTELRAQSASFPNIQELTGELGTIQQSVQQMVTDMKTLMADVIHIKQDMKRHQQNPQRRTASLTAFSMTEPSTSHSEIGTWTVEIGDTLWGISQKYQTTVETLITMNHLTSDVIVEGQTLKVPVIVSGQGSEQDDMDEESHDLLAEDTESP